MKRIVGTMLLAMVAICVNAQPNPEILWSQTYGACDFNDAVAVLRVDNGGYVAVGVADCPDSLLHIFVVRTDDDGDTLWTRLYGETDHWWAGDISEASDGGFVVCGYVCDAGYEDRDCLLMKINDNGDSVWVRTYGEDDQDCGNSVIQALDGGYLVVGWGSSHGHGGVLAVRTDENGDTIWVKTYDVYMGEIGYDVQRTNDGGYIIAGSILVGALFQDVFLVKIDSDGDTLWTRTYGGDYIDEGYSVQQTVDGGYIVVGGTMSYGVGGNNIYVIRVDSIGDTLWTRTYGETIWSVANSVEMTLDGDYIITGWVYVDSTNLKDICLMRIGDEGELLWSRTYGGLDWDIGADIKPTLDGGYIVLGTTYSYGSHVSSLYLVKTGPDEYTGVSQDLGFRIMETHVLHEPYPNPLNSQVKIVYDVLVTGKVKLFIYNVLGQRVVKIANNAITPGSYSVVWDAGELPSGVYFVMMEAGDFRQVRKVVLLK